MKSFFKTEKFSIDGEEITIRELSAGDSVALSDKKEVELIEFVCSRCVVEWKEETIDTIRENVPTRIMREIVERVFALSGMDLAKNSEATPGAGSSTA